MEVPQRVVHALRQLSDGRGAAIVATTDADGKPHTAPFGSLRVQSPSALRFGCDRGHDTYANSSGTRSSSCASCSRQTWP